MSYGKQLRQSIGLMYVKIGNDIIGCSDEETQGVRRMNAMINELKERRSIRSFKADPIPQEVLDQIIEAGLYAASSWANKIRLLCR